MSQRMECNNLNLSGSETSMTIANQLPWRNPNKMYTSISYKIISQSAGKKKLIGDCDVFVLRDYV